MDSETAEDIKRHFDVVADGLRTGFAEVRTEVGGLRTEVGALRQEIADVRRHADVVAEALRSDIRTVAEGVVGMDEKFTREFEKVREEMAEGLGEVKSLLRASYVDLDRRVRVLEKNPPS
ncbi:MAG TPA: hypothetical protein VIY96_08630 [Thermoanaerobaculia bacterium]